MARSNNPSNSTLTWTFAQPNPVHHYRAEVHRGGKSVPRFDLSSLSNLTPDRHRLRTFESLEIVLWSAVVLTALADLLLTAVGLSMGFSERNRFGAWVLSTWGFAGLIVLKLVVIAVAAVAWWRIPDQYRIAIPAAVAAPWGIAILTNAIVILSS